MIRFSNTLLLLAACTVLTFSTARAGESLPYYNEATFTPKWLTGEAAAKAHRVGAFSFTDHHGGTITEKDIAGKVVVANYFFPACHGLCPTTMRNLRKVGEAFRGDKDVVLLSHSLTTETDTVESLAVYAREMEITQPGWHLLTGERKAFFRHARTTFFAGEDLGEKTAEDTFLHTENFFLLDQRGHIRGIYAGTRPTDMKMLIDDINALKDATNS